jgi:hypothetical protein
MKLIKLPGKDSYVLKSDIKSVGLAQTSLSPAKYGMRITYQDGDTITYDFTTNDRIDATLLVSEFVANFNSL